MFTAKSFYLVFTRREASRRLETTLTGDRSSNSTLKILPLTEAVESRSPRRGPSKGDDLFSRTKGASFTVVDDGSCFSSADFLGSPWPCVSFHDSRGKGPRAYSAGLPPASGSRP